MRDNIASRPVTPGSNPLRLAAATPHSPHSGGEFLACARCGQPLVASRSVMSQREHRTLKQAVYAYEIDVLGTSTWCYSVTSKDGSRYDIIRAIEVASGGATGGGLSSSSGGSLGVMVMDKSSCPEDSHSWFSDYAWKAVRCGGCRLHTTLLGWVFVPKEGDMPGFFALILTRLREITPHLAPRLLSASLHDAEPLAFRQQRGLRGLSAVAGQTAGSNEAFAAVRGVSSMPSQFLPRTEAASRGPRAHAPSTRASPRPGPRLRPPAPEAHVTVEPNPDGDDSDSSAESADFQERRSAQRLHSCELAAKSRAQTSSRIGCPKRPLRGPGVAKVLPALEVSVPRRR